MKVIKHGITYKGKKCDKCSALLSYCEKDIQTKSKDDEYFGDYHYSCRKYIVCPECNNEIDLSWIIDGEEQIEENNDGEKILREQIVSECIEKRWIEDMYIAQSKDYDFTTCPDNFDCLQGCTFSALCDEISDTYPCKKCWKNFLRGGIKC